MDAGRLDADRLIAGLALAPHPEGGWYRETWRDAGGTAILYLLRGGERCAWHRLHGHAEIWHFYAGSPLMLRTAPGSVAVLGPDLSNGEQPQIVVPPGVWQYAEPTGEWSLVGTTVAPPFDLAALETAARDFNPETDAAGTSNVATVIPASAPDSPATGDAATSPVQPAAAVATARDGTGAPPSAGSTVPAATPVDPATDRAETLSIDIGGTGLKASVLGPVGQMERDRVRIDTPYPLAPDKLVHVLTDLVKPLGHYDRVSVGFPGMVRGGLILSAPHFVSAAGPGGEPSSKLTAAWARYDLESALGEALGKPTKVANDADLQGSAVVQGHGLELVVTLGTGVGSALFNEGMLLPHLELAHHTFRKSLTYNEALGDAVRKQLGNKKWNRRVAEMIEVLRALTFFDHLYIGGGNSARVDLKLDKDVTLVDNSAGILGGIKLWHRSV